MRRTDPEHAAAALADDQWTLVDVREADELAIVKIEGALHFPLSEFTQSFRTIPTDKPIALLCHHGGRSAQAQAFLAHHGITETLNVEGGIDLWAHSVDTTLARY